MKKASILLLLFCLAIVFQAAAQERNMVQGVCKDENGKAIENVSVYAHDSLLVAITDHETLVFDTEGNVLERYPLTFHEYRNWKGKMVPDHRWKRNILVDAARKEFYTIFVNDGLGTLNRIDIKTGTVKPVMDLSGYPFAEMVRVHNGVLYFLYPKGQNHRKALYQVRIE